MSYIKIMICFNQHFYFHDNKTKELPVQAPYEKKT